MLDWFKRLYDQLLQRHLGFADLEFVRIDDREMDPSAADGARSADRRGQQSPFNKLPAYESVMASLWRRNPVFLSERSLPWGS